MIEDLDGRVAVVTGGASGIGLAMGEAFLKAGMTVVLSDVDEPALEREVARLSVTFSDQIRGQVCDVTDNDAVVELANSVRDRHGPVHVLCNNAGVAPAAPILQSTPSQWKWTFDINVQGVAHGVLAFVPQMVEAGIGHVVNTASQAGLATNTRCGVYAAVWRLIPAAAFMQLASMLWLAYLRLCTVSWRAPQSVSPACVPTPFQHPSSM